MPPSKETKFGYGFLLVGTGVPFLIERLLGPSWAIGVAISCTAIGVWLLFAGHTHKERTGRVSPAGIVFAVLLVLATAVSIVRLHCSDKDGASQDHFAPSNLSSREELKSTPARQSPQSFFASC